MNDYFVKNENVQIDAFLQVPKILFSEKYKKLSTNAKLIYSLYLNRYIGTTFKDESGDAYIIYPDKELEEKLNINRTTCSRAKKDLIKLDLITLEKSISYNRIYIHNPYTSKDKTYYSLDDIKAMQFYKFPIELFNESFIKLNLNAKLLYVYYLDYISLSQVHNFVDSKERVFFYDNSQTQGKEINLSSRTITTCRNLLFASGLLLKYQGYSNKAQYYLKKLSCYDEKSLITYIELPKEQQKGYIKNKNKVDNEQLDDSFAKLQHTDDKDATSSFAKLHHGDDKIASSVSQLSNIQLSKDESSDSQKHNQEFSKKETHIINTHLNKTNLNNDLINYINKLLLFNRSSIIENKEKSFMEACLNKINDSHRFILKKRDHQIQLEAPDICSLLSKIQTQYQYNTIIQMILDRIKNRGYLFKTPENQINCFLSFLFNELTDRENLNDIQEPDWFNTFSFTRPTTNTNTQELETFDNDIKNYNWWEN